MTTIKEQAQAYEPKATRNISELDSVSTNLEIREETFNQGTKDEFTINVATLEGEDYRVPTSVLKQLKAQLEENPNLEFFKVKKQGEGMSTTYTVVPQA